MADIIAFSPKAPAMSSGAYREETMIGAESGITIRILSRHVAPHDLLVVLHGTHEGCTTVAALPEGEWSVANAIAQSALAALTAAGLTWGQQQTG